jgi:hypothetical protein
MPHRTVPEHPSLELIRQFAEGRLGLEQNRRVVEHILQGCRLCGDEAARYNLRRLRQVQPVLREEEAFLSR